MPFPDISGSIRDYCSAAGQSTQAVFSKLKTFRNDPEFFQKVCQVAFAAIELIIMQCPGAASLSRVSAVLRTANMHDFYLFLKFPRQFFFPVTAQTINENKALDSMESLLIGKCLEYVYQDLQRMVDEDDLSLVQKLLFQPGLVNSSEDKEYFRELLGRADDEEIPDPIIMRDIAGECLRQQLELMDANSYAYPNVDEFKSDLQVRLGSDEFKAFIFSYLSDAFKDLHGIDPTDDDKDELRQASEAISTINLEDLNPSNGKPFDITLNHVPLLERITNVNWNFVDVLCVTSYCQEWGFIDTVRWSESIGQFKVLQWVKDQSLDTWLVGLVSTAFALKLLEAVRKLFDDKLTPEQRTIAKWNVATSFAELFFYGAIYLNNVGKTSFNLAALQCFAIFSKSLGLLAIAVRPKHEFFQIPVAASAA